MDTQLLPFKNSYLMNVSNGIMTRLRRRSVLGDHSTSMGTNEAKAIDRNMDIINIIQQRQQSVTTAIRADILEDIWTDILGGSRVN